jgi:sugar lactone lactonase YvrE
VDKAGNYYLALREGNAIYKMDPKSGRMTRFAGTGEKGFTGDGAAAKTATLSGPKGVALAPDGSLYIADTENHAIRKVDSKGVITTVAGNGKRGELARPHGVFVDTRGALYIGDSENNRILLVK